LGNSFVCQLETIVFFQDMFFDCLADIQPLGATNRTPTPLSVVCLICAISAMKNCIAC